MTRLLLSVFIILSLSQICQAQLEENSMVLYAKANVLLESGRYDEAVRMYNRILSADENHTNALFSRAKAKYELSAFKGTKNDIMVYIEKVGVDKRVLDLMANTELQLGNLVAAKNYALSALEMDPFDKEMFVTAGDIFLDLSERNDACEHYSLAVNLGSGKATRRINEHCDGYTARKRNNTSIEDDTDVMVKSEEDNMVKDDMGEEMKKDDDGIVSLEDIVREAETDPTLESPPTGTSTQRDPDFKSTSKGDDIDINASQTIEIDDLLSITINDGLGDRVVESQPNIFMLSDQDGKVVIDLCVDSRGRVTEATFNRDLSNIYRSSLTSLALRKAKEFFFDLSSIDEQCGRLTFNIKA